MKNWIKGLFASLIFIGVASYGSSFPSSSISSAFFEKLKKNEAGTKLLENLEGREIEAEASEDSPTIRFRVDSKRLAWICRLEDQIILVFDPREKSWPGNNSITIVVTNQDYELIDWIETGGSDVFEWAEVHEKEDISILKTLSRRRSGGTTTERFCVYSNEIKILDSQSDRSLRLGTFLYEDK